MRTVLKGRQDPVWFMTEVLGNELFPVQADIARRFYQQKYDPSLPPNKYLHMCCGMRCVTGDTLVYTKEGIQQIKDIDESGSILTRFGMYDYTHKIEQDSQPIIKFKTRYGYELKGSHKHPVLVMNSYGDHVWQKLPELKVGDFVCISRKTPNGSWKPIGDLRIARLLGLLVGDGCYTMARKNSFTFTSADERLISDFTSIVKEKFNLVPLRYNGKKNGCTVDLRVNSKVAREQLDLDYVGSYNKTVPNSILNGSINEITAFLQGLFDTDGYILNNGSSVHLDCTSEKLIKQVQNILVTQYGIISSVRYKSIKYTRQNGEKSYCWCLTIYHDAARLFYDKIGFTLPRKIKEPSLKSTSQVDKIPHLHKLLRKMKRESVVDSEGWEEIRHQCYGNLRKNTPKASGITYFILDKIIDYFDGKHNAVEYLKWVRYNHLFYDEIVSIEQCNDEILYDVHVPGYHEFISNGIVSHNSGKTALASMIMAYEFFDICTLESPSVHYNLLKNQKIFIIGVATSTELAEDGVYSNMYNMLESNEWISSWTNTDFYKGRINCNDKHVHAEVLGSWANTAVGRTSKLVVFDELDLFEQTESRRGAWEIYTRLSKSTATLGFDGHVLACSSPQTPTGIMMTLYKQGLSAPHTVSVLYKSWEMNPHLSEEGLKAEYRAKGDMGAFYRDFACAPEMTGGMQFPEGIVMTKMTNVLRSDFRVNRTMRSRVMAIDPAVKNDGFGMSCGYQDEHLYVVDGAIKFTKDDGASYIKPSDIWSFMERAIPKLNINELVFDTWMFPEIIEKVEEKFGITAQKHIVEKEDYDRWRELQNSEEGDFKVMVVEDEELKREAEDLLVINNPRKPKVDHPYSGCFVGETRIRALDGSCPTIAELQDKTIWVMSCTPDGRLVPGYAKGKLTKYVNELIEIVLDSGASFKCTPEHPIMMRDGTYKAAKDIVPELDRLMPCRIHQIGGDGYYEFRDIDISSLEEAKCKGALNPHQASKMLNCGRNVIMRVLRENNFDSWAKFMNETTGDNHRVIFKINIYLDYAIPVYDLEVERWNNFGLLSGVFVHNSKDIADCVANVIWFMDNFELENLTPMVMGFQVV